MAQAVLRLLAVALRLAAGLVVNNKSDRAGPARIIRRAVLRRLVPTRHALPIGLVALTGITILSGCTIGGPPDRAAPEPAELTAAQRRDLAGAEEVLVRRCMQAQGFQYHSDSAEPALAEDREFPYGIDDRGWAQRHGLGLEIRAMAGRRAGADNANNRYTETLDPRQRQAYSTALFGTGTRVATVTVPSGDTVSMSADGCLATAQTQLYGDHLRWFAASAITNNLSGAIQPLVLADPRYRKVADAWSECMSEYGFAYRDPVDLRSRFTSSSQADEWRIATSEADCVTRTGLAETGQRLEQELGAPVRARYAADIHTYRQLQAAALPRAAGLISVQSGTGASD